MAHTDPNNVDGGKKGRRWTAAQYKDVEGVDLRRLVGKAVGPKRKREEPEDAEQAEADMQVDEEDRAGPGPLSIKRQRADDATWRPVSGKTWKAAGERAATVMKAKSNKTWDKRMQEKANHQQLQAIKKEAVDAAKAKRKAIADHRKAAKERKFANRAKNEVVQKVNSATAKKMMKDKKKKKMLRTADTN